MAEAVPRVVIFCSLVLVFAQWENFLERNTFSIRAINILRKQTRPWSRPSVAPGTLPCLVSSSRDAFYKFPTFSGNDHNLMECFIPQDF